MSWSFTCDRPIYSQIIDRIEFLILSGHYSVGQKLPSVREFASDVSVNPNTMQKALSELEKKGLIVTHRTCGKFITDDSNLIYNLKLQKAQELSLSFFDEMDKIGYNKQQTIEILTKFSKGDYNYG